MENLFPGYLRIDNGEMPMKYLIFENEKKKHAQQIQFRTDSIIKEESHACLLCNDGPCTSSCPYGVEPDRILRAVRFSNLTGAVDRMGDFVPCMSCDGRSCMDACLKGAINKPVDIASFMESLAYEAERHLKKEKNRADLHVSCCGVLCENPFFLSSSVVGSNYEMVAKAFEMGWAGVAFKTIGLFVPKEVSPRFDVIKEADTSFRGFKNIEQISDHTLEENVSFITRLKKDYPEKVIIASIMGRNEDEWTKLAQIMTQAGADIIECNYSCPHMTEDGLGSDVGQNPELVECYTKAVRKGTSLPILAKMTPNIGNMNLPARASIRGGADGLAAINTIKSLMNFNTDSFVSGPEVEGKTSVGGYSGKAVKPIALRFIHELKTDPELINIPVSGMGGIETWKDALEFILLGCSTVQITTAVMEYGYRIIEDLIEGMEHYMNSRNIRTIHEIMGKGIETIISADALNRESIFFPKFNRSLCIGCGRCYLSCYDGGHQAIRQDDDSRKPVLDAKKCVGCHLCAAVCPAQAISGGFRVKK